MDYLRIITEQLTCSYADTKTHGHREFESYLSKKAFEKLFGGCIVSDFLENEEKHLYVVSIEISVELIINLMNSKVVDKELSSLISKTMPKELESKFIVERLVNVRVRYSKTKDVILVDFKFNAMKYNSDIEKD